VLVIGPCRDLRKSLTQTREQVAASDLQHTFQDVTIHHSTQLVDKSATTVSPQAIEDEQTGDDYLSPNSLGLRRVYVVIDVSNSGRVQNSVLSGW
jgi:hypothetical protein